eukprot:8703879-Pyramimonas_sp.AAC.1
MMLSSNYAYTKNTVRAGAPLASDRQPVKAGLGECSADVERRTPLQSRAPRQSQLSKPDVTTCSVRTRPGIWICTTD